MKPDTAPCFHGAMQEQQDWKTLAYDCGCFTVSVLLIVLLFLLGMWASFFS